MSLNFTRKSSSSEYIQDADKLEVFGTGVVDIDQLGRYENSASLSQSFD
jgi:hypothetical protein